MIGRLIEVCIGNRAMVLLLTTFLVAAGIWSANTKSRDPVPSPK